MFRVIWEMYEEYSSSQTILNHNAIECVGSQNARGNRTTGLAKHLIQFINLGIVIYTFITVFSH
jgi:hypothetical protein